MGRMRRGNLMLTRSFEFERIERRPAAQGLTAVVEDEHPREQVGDVALASER